MGQIHGGRLAYWLTRRSLCSDNSPSSLYYSCRGLRTSPWMLRDASCGKGSQSMASKDYYEVLGVRKDASKKQIKFRYDKALAMSCPFDVYNPKYMEKILQLDQTLMDNKKRTLYDQLCSSSRRVCSSSSMLRVASCGKERLGTGSISGDLHGSQSMASRDYYDVLGVSKNADALDIRCAFDRALQKMLPFKVHDREPMGKFLELYRAYAALQDDEKRTHYDQLYSSSRSVCASSSMIPDSNCGKDVIVTGDKRPQLDSESVKSEEIQVQDAENSTSKKTTTTKARVRFCGRGSGAAKRKRCINEDFGYGC